MSAVKEQAVREIKFREWRHSEKEMYQIDLHNEALFSIDENDVIMQYSGIKDRNGK